jgi:hypothetical protein
MRFFVQFRCSEILALALCLVLMGAAGCKRNRGADLTPLDNLGLSYSSLEELRSLEVRSAEVPELVKAKRAGLSDAGCVDLLRIARARQHAFADGDGVASLLQVGMSEQTVLELARLNQLGLQTGEEQAMRLAGLSDRVILAMARRRAAGQPALSGAALARMKNAGVGEEKMLELIDRGLTDEQVAATIRHR